jgi:dihydrofolate synthase/folylpolyglutamate synthase
MTASLGEWLDYIERLHSRPIVLGLDRVRRVGDALGIVQGPPVITVGGTNGKGSTCAMLERILACAGYRVGLYTSPHLLRYNERVRVAGVPVPDEALAEAFLEVELARLDVPLTYFEFGTLAAWQVFSRSRLDALILEVGMGGRLDAVNIVDADCAVVTNVDLDHTEFLGATREQIGYEKAGIFRPGRPAIVADPNAPATLLGHAESLGADCRLLGRDFGFVTDANQWQFWSRRGDRIVRRGGLAHPALRGASQLLNASAAIAALESMAGLLPVSMQDIRRGLMEVELPGRFQILPGRPTVVLDVAHNPHAAASLAANLGDMGFFDRTWAVFGMLKDKDVAGVVERVASRIDRWLLASLDGPRGASAGQLAEVLELMGIAQCADQFVGPAVAYRAAQEQAAQNDRIVVFGSFLTVAGAMSAMEQRR